MITCMDLEDEPWFPGCCDSCHDDANSYGYELFEFVDEDKKEYRVCCRVRNAIYERDNREG